MRALPLSLLVLLAAPALAQTTWHVDASAAGPGTGSAQDPFPSIQTAIAQPATLDGDTVLVHPGTYTELVDLLDKQLVLRSSGGAALTTIDVSTQFSIEQSAVKIRGGQGPACRLEGFTLVGGDGTFLTEPVQGLQFFAGGGLLLVDVSPTIAGCVVRDCSPDVGAGAFVIGGQPVFEDCEFHDNLSTRYGAGLHASLSQVTLREVSVHDNQTFAGDGGGVHLFGGSLTIEGGTLAYNQAWSGGSGGNLALRYGATALVTDATLAHGFTLDGNGGGAWVEGSSASFAGCTFDSNTAGDVFSNREGGAIHVDQGGLELASCKLQGNYSARGGAIFLQGATASIEGSQFLANHCESGLNFFHADGGALAASGSSAWIYKTIFSGNLAECSSPDWNGTIARGGALWTDTPGVQVSHCAFMGNEAWYDADIVPGPVKLEPGAQGGAIFGPVWVMRSRILGNRAWANPAKLHVYAQGGGAWGATILGSLLQANEVDGVGSQPDVGPAAEACALTCCVLIGNLPATLPPLGPLCTSSCP